MQNSRPLLAKLVIGISALVALASSAPPQWFALEQGQLHLVFDERNERKAILSIEVTGKLYAAAQGGTVELVTTSDRDASDLVLSARPLPSDTAVLDPTDAPPDAEAQQSLSLLGALAAPDLSSPTMAWLSVPLECAQDDPPARRPKSCVEQFEITLTRSSQQPLSVDLTATVEVDGPGQTPPGTLQVFLVESAP
jgi:hypothetical protein